MAGYNRQSRPDITNGADITAPPLNAEFDQIETAFGIAGHTHDGTTGNAPKINLATSVAGYLQQVNGGVGGANNTTATSNPTITDDTVAGYAKGSLWLNTTTNRIYVCVSDTSSSAAWYEIAATNSANNILPSGDGVVDLGVVGNRFADLLMAGDATIGGSITVTAASSFQNNVDVTGDLDVDGSLTVDTNATVTGDTTLNGNTIIGNANTDTVAVNAQVSTNIVPNSDDARDLGEAAKEFRNLFLDGTAHIDTLDVDESATVAVDLTVGGNAQIDTNLDVDGVTTLNGNTTIGDAGTDVLYVNSEIATSLVPSATNLRDLGTATKEFRDLYLDGAAHIDTLDVDENATVAGTLGVTGNTTLTGTLTTGGITGTSANFSSNVGVSGTATIATVDINGGNIDATQIGVSNPDTARFTTVETSGLASLATVNIDGGNIDGTIIGATTPDAATFTTATANNGFTGDLAGNVSAPTGTSTFDNITASGTITGDVTGDISGNVNASTGTSTFNDVTINGTLNMDAGTTATITNLTEPTNSQDAATKNYVDTNDALKLNLSGGTMSGAIAMGNNKVTNVATPTASSDAATKGYVDQEVSALVDAAPGTLDTLNELAAALGDDPDFATTVTDSIATKLPLAGGTMSGDISMGSNAVTSTANPTTDDELARKGYVDARDATKLNLSGGTMSGEIAMGSNKITGVTDPTANQDAATKAYVDQQDGLQVTKSGDTMSGDLAMGSNNITGLATPTSNDHAASKGYTDGILGSATASSASAAAAATSATSAADSATAAAGSASTANTAKQDTLDALDEFTDIYLGAKSSGPSVDNDGDALDTGAIYYNTTDNQLYVWDGTNWDQAAFTLGQAIANIIEDTTPQLGGNLDLNTNTINGTGDINITGTITSSGAITGALSGNASTATALQTGRSIALGGDVTGSATFDGTGDITITTTATSDPTLTLSGDASGSATFTNLGNATLSVTVADDSHNHVISNVDGLQTALDGKLSTSGKAADSNLLDGIDSASFLRSDADDTASGIITLSSTARDTLNFSGNATDDYRGVAFNGRAALTADYNDGYLRLNNASEFSNGVFTPGVMRADGGFTMSGATVWNSGNDGSGSGLDADTVDGLQASSFLRSDAADSTASTISFTGDIEVGDQIFHHGDTDTYLQFDAANSFRIVTGNVQRVKVNSTGIQLGDSGNGYFQPVSGNYGSIQIDGGAHGGYEGYSIGGRAVFMHNGATTMGLFDDVNNEWAVRCVFNGTTELSYNGVGKLDTLSNGVSINGNLYTDGSNAEDYDALSGTSPTCNVDSAGAFSLTMSGNTTFTFSGADSGWSMGFILQLTGNGSTVTWPSSVDWAGGTAPDAPASGESNLYVFYTRDGGTNWIGVLSSAAYA